MIVYLNWTGVHVVSTRCIYYCTLVTVTCMNSLNMSQSISLPLSLYICIILYDTYESESCRTYGDKFIGIRVSNPSIHQPSTKGTSMYPFNHSPWCSYEQFPATLQAVLWNPDTLEQHRKLQCAGAVTCVILSNDGGLTLNQKTLICYMFLARNEGRPRAKYRSRQFWCPGGPILFESHWSASSQAKAQVCGVDSYLRDS